MYYTGMDNSNYPDAGFMQIGYATSPDGYNWDKFQDNPVIQYGDNPSWNNIGSGGAAILYSDGIYEMWYSGVKTVEAPHEPWDSLKVGYAVSLDGKRWIQYPGNPVLTANAGDSTAFWAIDVIRNEAENHYTMYFESEHWHYQDPFNPDTTFAVNAIFYATAPRDVLFSPDCNVSVSNDVTINQGESTQLDASGGEHYQWMPEADLNNPYVADPIATPDTTTTYKVIIVGDSCINTAEVVVTVEDPAFLKQHVSKNMTVSPNPFSDKTTVFIPENQNGTVDLKISDAQGKIVRSFSNIDRKKISIDKGNLPAGLYVFGLYADSELIEKIKVVLK